MRSDDNTFTNDDIIYYGLDQHPNLIDSPLPILKYPQKGLRGKYHTKRTEKAEKAGLAFESHSIGILNEYFPDAIIISDAYFLTGNYIPQIHLYATKQIDALLITSAGVFVIECKYMSDDINKLIGRRTSKKWTRHGGSPKSVLNGLRQNEEHGRYINAILAHSHIECPVHRITVIGGLSSHKIRVGKNEDDNLVHETELVTRIESILENPFFAIYDPVAPKAVESCLRIYMSDIPNRDTLHYIYSSKGVNTKEIVLPKTCKGETEPFKKTNSSFTES